MAQIENTALKNEISLIMAANNSTDIKNYIAYIHVMETNQSYKVLKVMSLDIDRNYAENFSDVIIIEVAIPVGTYSDLIYPYKDNLELTLLKSPIYYTSKIEPSSIRYKSVIEDTGKPRIQSGKYSGATTELLDISNFTVVKFQLIELASYILRNVSIGCIVRKSTVKDTLLTLLTNQVNQLKLDNKTTISGIDLIEPNNTELKEQIVIPYGTKLVNLPYYIQTKVCGVYNSGIASYIQNNIWYIYPQYNIKRETENDRTIDFILVPEDKYPGITSTYRKKGDRIVVMITGSAKAFDNVKVNQMNNATGVRFSNSESFFDTGTIKRENNKVIIDRSSMNTEIIAMNQPDGINRVPISENRITSNPFNEYSKLAKLQGKIMAFVWENSNPDIIKPGMMCNLYSMDKDGDIIYGYGVIKSVTHNTRLVYPGIVESKYTTNTGIEIIYNDDNFNN